MMNNQPERINAIRLSDKQYCQLQAIRDHPRSVVKMSELEGYNQLTLGGNKRRQFIVETPGRDGIVLTQKGWKALDQFANADFLRKIASTHFSSYLTLEEQERPKRETRSRAPYAASSGKKRRAA